MFPDELPILPRGGGLRLPGPPHPGTLLLLLALAAVGFLIFGPFTH